MKIYESIKRLSLFEKVLWIFSILIIVLSFILGRTDDYLSLVASLIGVTALIFTAKGDVLGQFLIVVFSVFYGLIFFTFGYYGEMITYLGMTTPIAILSIISWIKNPFDDTGEVAINTLNRKESMTMFMYALIITFVFYYILKYFNTAFLIISTISITTSFLASYLTYQRSPFYAIAYAFNDIVLITLWILATLDNITYFPMAICFIMFLVNDIYGFYNWKQIKNKQESRKTEEQYEI